MDSKAFSAGGIALRASITVAVSAALMAGLHYAPLRGFSPSQMLFGHPEEVAALPAAPEAQPNIRFIAIPEREAFPPAPAAAPKPALTAELPAPISVVPTPRPAGLTARPAAAVPVATAALVLPTPRPAPVRRAALPDTAPAPLSRLPLQDALPAVPELALVGELVPEPQDEAGRFELADLVPSPRGVLRGVATVGRTVGNGARYAANEIADGAMTIVGR